MHKISISLTIFLEISLIS